MFSDCPDVRQASPRVARMSIVLLIHVVSSRLAWRRLVRDGGPAPIERASERVFKIDCACLPPWRVETRPHFPHLDGPMSSAIRVNATTTPRTRPRANRGPSGRVLQLQLPAAGRGLQVRAGAGAGAAVVAAFVGLSRGATQWTRSRCSGWSSVGTGRPEWDDRRARTRGEAIVEMSAAFCLWWTSVDVLNPQQQHGQGCVTSVAHGDHPGGQAVCCGADM